MRLHSVQGFTFLGSLYIALESMVVSGFIPSAFTTFESDFGISASYTALIITAVSITKIFTVIPLTYYFGKGHIPRNLAKLLFLLAIGSLFSALPWVILGSDGLNNDEFLCLESPRLCSLTNSDRQYYVWFVIVGQVIQAIGASCQYTLFPAFINNNSNSDKGSFYVSFIYASGPIGAAVGFLWMGSSVDSGMWGLPFIVVTFLYLLLVPLLWTFPRTLQSAEDGHLEEDVLFASWNDFKESARTIFTKRVWWCVALALSSEAFMLEGYASLGPKYVESFFGVSAGFAGIIVGVVLVPAGAFGQILGGWIDSKRNLCLRDTARFSTQLAVLALILVLCIAAVSCPTIQVQGFSDSCQGECNCEENFAPVCFNNSEVHFNACYLGCQEFDADTGTYSNCSSISSCNNQTGTVSTGVCESQLCGLLVPFLALLFFAVFFTFMNNVPAIIVLLRSVPKVNGALSLAFNDVVYKLTGSIPGAQAFAAAFDSACLAFNVDSCGEKRNCAFYDNDLIRYYFSFIFGGAGKTTSLFFFALSFYLLSRSESAIGLKPYKDRDHIPAPKSSTGVSTMKT